MRNRIMPEEFEDFRKEEHKKSTKYIKKIFAGKGKISGNFFYTGGTGSSDNQIVLVTLTIKDKKGKRVRSEGKKARKN